MLRSATCPNNTTKWQEEVETMRNQGHCLSTLLLQPPPLEEHWVRTVALTLLWPAATSR
jgi:hypothetical protein